jgi:hypothetical protein
MLAFYYQLNFIMKEVTSLIERKNYILLRSLFKLFILFFAISIAIGCTNSTDSTGTASNTNDTNDTIVNTPESLNSTSAFGIPAVDPRLDIIYLTEQQFESLQANIENKKIIFQFCTTDKGTTLLAWRYNDTMRPRYSNEIYLDNFKKSEVVVRGTVIFGNQKLGKNKIANLNTRLRNSNRNEILAFYPVISNNNRLSYNIHILPSIEGVSHTHEFKADGRDSNTNPSPPASDNPNEDDDL